MNFPPIFKTIFWHVFTTCILCKFRPQLSLHSIPGDHGLNELNSTLPKDVCTQVTWTAFLGFKKILKFDPHYGPTLSPAIMIWVYLYLPYLKMLPHKFRLFCSNGFWGKRFFKNFLYLLLCKNLTPSAARILCFVLLWCNVPFSVQTV